MGQSFSFTVNTDRGYPVPAVSVIGTLPAGLAFVDNGDGTGTISGIPTGPGAVAELGLAASNGIAPAAASALALTVRQVPAVTTAPTDQKVVAGAPVVFTAAASGFPAPTAQWSGSTDGGSTYASIAGAPASTYAFTAAAGDDGNRYRVTFENAAGSAWADAALSVGTAPTFSSAAAGPGGTARITGSTTDPAATSTVTLTAVAPGSADVTRTLTIVVADAPTISLPLSPPTGDGPLAGVPSGVQPGQTITLVGYFSGWDETFRANAVTRAWAQGRMPMMTWESRPINSGNDTTEAPAYSLPKIIGGDFDAYLHQYAKDIVATGLPLAIRLDHEMKATWYPWSETDAKGNPINGNNVGDYVKMWRHVHDIFQQEGANSLVIWVWAPNIVNNLAATHKVDGFLEKLYPGDDYVDWVGLSGYLRPPYKSDNDFSFDYTFKPSLDKLRALTKKPIILAEIGASETGGYKAKWVTALFDGLARPENDDIIGFSWFNLAVTSYVEGVRATNDWRIDSRADTLSAFIAGLTRPEDRFTLTPAP